MLNYLRIGGAALIALALLYGGWKVNDWRYEAGLVKAARSELQAEQQRRIDAVAAKNTVQKERDAARSALAAAELKAKEAKIEGQVKVVKETVVKYVQKNPSCDLPERVASQLQHLREGGEQ